MALIQYPFMCKPNYNEDRLFELISKDIKKFIIEVQEFSEQFPNNRNLNRIYNFFQTQHLLLSKVLEEQKKEE